MNRKTNRWVRTVVLYATVLLIAVSFPHGARLDQQAAVATMIRYDVDSTTATACRMLGQTGSPDPFAFGGNRIGPARLDTVGSSATVVSETASSGALTPVVARDILFITRASGTATPVVDPFAAGTAAVILSKADNDTVTVDPAVNWSEGVSYTFLTTSCGTTNADGAVNTAGATRITLRIQYEQGDLDALAWQFQCRSNVPSSLWEIVYPSEDDKCGNAGTQVSGFCEFATAGATASFSWEEFGAWGACRILFKDKTTDTSDAGANLERVTGSITVTK